MQDKDPRYDIIGDIHGHADTLRALLQKLGYQETAGAYRHPERTVIFVGDFIDRGPKIREVLQIVRAMQEAGAAQAVMGNHEYNALCFHTPDNGGGHLRPHTDKNVKQHKATLDQIADPCPEEWRDWLAWFQTLPLFLDLGGLRVVHAAWDDDQIAFLNGSNRLTDELLHASARRGTPEYRAIDVLLKGKEIDLPDGYTFTIKDGTERRAIRVKWWLRGAGRTYHDMALPTYDTAPKMPVPLDGSLERGYAETEPPVIVGHYWLPPAPQELLAPNVACVDYSVAKDGPLVAYRWDGERVLDAGKLVSTPGASGFTVFVDDNFHYMDEDERYQLGVFATYDQALAACKQIVDEFLVAHHKPGMSAASLCSAYTGFGEDPWIAGEQDSRFSAWDYARSRCNELCGLESLPTSQSTEAREER